MRQSSRGQSFRRRGSVDVTAGSLYYLPKIVPPSAIADDDHLDTAWFWLPAHLRIRDAVRVYSSATDGLRLATLLDRCVEHAVEENLLLVKTADDTVIGCFAASGWKAEAAPYGSGRCFLFELTPRFEKFGVRPNYEGGIFQVRVTACLRTRSSSARTIVVCR